MHSMQGPASTLVRKLGGGPGLLLQSWTQAPAFPTPSLVAPRIMVANLRQEPEWGGGVGGPGGLALGPSLSPLGYSYSTGSIAP